MQSPTRTCSSKRTEQQSSTVLETCRRFIVFDVSSQKEVKRLRIGQGGGGGILIQPDGQRAYVAFAEGNIVAVVDLKTLEVVGKIEAGPNPDGLAWAIQQ